MTWQRTRLKYLAAAPIVNGLGEAAQEGDPSWPRYIRTTDIASPRRLHEDIRASLPPATARQAMLRNDDLLLCAAGSLGKVYLHSSNEPACYAGYLVRFRPRPDLVDPSFIAYWAESQPFLDQIAVGAVRSTIDNFSAGKYQQMELFIPPLEEQRRVADFLDAETGQIDHLVRLRRQQMVLSSSRLLSSCSLALFGGGRRDTDTGIPTIGPVPSTWSVLRNKYLMREVRQTSATGHEELLSVSHLTGVAPRATMAVTITMAESTVGYKLVEPDDLVINTLWAWMGALGVSQSAGLVSPAYGVYRVTSALLLPAYLHFVCRSREYVCEMTRFSKGVWSSRLRLYPESFLALSMPVPPLKEQRGIVADLEQEQQAHDARVELLERSISKLNERRSALITAAVTGQLDVAAARGVA